MKEVNANREEKNEERSMGRLIERREIAERSWREE